MAAGNVLPRGGVGGSADGIESSVAAALAQASAALAAAGIAGPRAEARLLLAAIIAGGAAAVTGYPERRLSAAEAAAFAALVGRRAAREPLSHILGRREFWSLDFQVSAAVLDPRPDSETLVQAVLEALPDRTRPWRLLDLGTGSGCLLLSLLSELPRAHGLGIDASPEALSLAGANALALGLGPRADFRRLDWNEPGWTAGLIPPADIVIANPPYIPSGEIAALAPEVARFEPRAALDGGGDGLDAYRRLAPALAGLVAAGGFVAFEVGAGQAAAVAAILAASARCLSVPEVRADLAGIARCLLWRRPGEDRRD